MCFWFIFRATNITAAMVREAAQLEHVALFRIRDGRVECEEASTDPAAATYLRVISPIAMPATHTHH